MIRRGIMGSLDFFHAQMRKAVHRAYLSDKVLLRTIHCRISDFLETLPSDDPMVRQERMGHLIGENNRLRAARYYAGLKPDGYSFKEKQTGSSWTIIEYIIAGESEHDSSQTNINLDWILSWLEAEGLSLDEVHRLTSSFQFGLLNKMAHLARLTPRLRIAKHTRTALQRLVEADSDNAECQRDLAVSQFRVGDVLLRQGDLHGALDVYQNALTIRQRLAGAYPSHAGWQRDLFKSYWNIAVLVEKTDLEKAIKWYGKAHLHLSDMNQKGNLLPQDEEVLKFLQKKFSPVSEPEENRLQSFDDEATLKNYVAHGRHLLNTGQIDAALTYYRSLLFPDEGIIMDQNAPAEIKIDFITTLMLSQRVDGVQVFLANLSDSEHPRVPVLRQLMHDWRNSLSWVQKFGLKKKPPLPIPPVPKS